ncbi:hypothetical protein BASA81_017518 [Batrachochytrium salamandrivorans]|nr:hypothetical protein BASA81_017518 [Batrachochytrium salamandrivorans]
MSTKKLTRRQARWSVGTFGIYFYYHSSPGKLNGRADSLSRREDYFWTGDQSNFQRIIDPDNVLDLQVCYRRISIFMYWFTVLSWISNDRVQVMKHYHESLAHLKYGSIIDLITRRFWWPDMKKDLRIISLDAPNAN